MAPGNAVGMYEGEGRAGARERGGNAGGDPAETESDGDSSGSDGHETTPVASPPPDAAQSAAQTAAEIEAKANGNLSKAAKKDKKETATSVLREYLQAMTTAASAVAGGPEACHAAGAGGPREASPGEVQLAVARTTLLSFTVLSSAYA
ncbi:hypothetical protein I4F81_003998 [Pyropia yezoensis]|uniref:Uncharacterized protein n=1 Tax=Pyropia yezoensis TaxID=2788 RepID=A0ACC3BUN3_PYRYE|nr:hypothetical protein I4F81_003998 [Neopyropia yezoensis]